MYRVAVVDDSVDFLVALERMVDWSSWGFNLVGTATTGTDALMLVREKRPHLLIADIRMPGMSGIDLAKTVKKLCSETKVVLISAYQEFEYAHAAIRLGADEYLLKPISMEDIKKAVLRVRKTLNQESDARRLHDEERKLVEQGRPLIRDGFFRRLVEGSDSISQSRFNEQVRLLNLKIASSSLLCMIVDIEIAQQNDIPSNSATCERYVSEVREQAKRVIEASGLVICFSDSHKRIVILIDMTNCVRACAGGKQALGRRWGLALQEELMALHGYGLSVGVARVIQGLSNVAIAYQQAEEALSHRLHLGRHKVIHVDDVHLDDESGIRAHCPRLAEMERHLLSTVCVGASAQIHSILETYFRALHGLATVSPSRAKRKVLALASSVSRLIEEHDINELSVSDDIILDRVLSALTLEETRNWLETFLREFCYSIQKRSALRLDLRVERSKDYILQNISEHLTLSNVAKVVGMSPNYFATVFKNLIGTTFHEYLVDMRIVQAKQLLSTRSYRVYEVADKVGYRDYRHFSRLFKHHVGLTPGAYANQSTYD